MANNNEKLPPGFWRSPAGSLRVQVRTKGYKTETKTFPLFSDTSAERRRQRIEAETWASETRRRMLTGTFVPTREAEALTLGGALRRYASEKLKGKEQNVQKDQNRIKQILADPISNRSVASLLKTDIAAYRDDLIQRGWRKSVETAIGRLEHDPENRKRVAELKDLEKLREQARSEQQDRARRALERRIAEVEAREGINEPARTTISNKIQLITRALRHLGQTTNGVPDLRGVSMPPSSPGRERRVSPEELNRLLIEGKAINPLLPLIIKFAIETALRRERILEFRLSYLRNIGGGRRAIVFPKVRAQKNKRTGVIPFTRDIQSIVCETLELTPEELETAQVDRDKPIFQINGNTFDHKWRGLVVSCDISDLHFHDLRHEATSRLFERGLTMAEVMSVTGHSTADMVARYSHYNAGIVYDKLDAGLDPLKIAAEIGFLVSQYKALGGDMSRLATNFEQP